MLLPFAKVYSEKKKIILLFIKGKKLIGDAFYVQIF